MRGRVHCDSYAGLRALLVPPSKRPRTAAGAAAPRCSASRTPGAGRWSDARAGRSGSGALAGGSSAAARGRRGGCIEHVARTLLRRYGVVCWRLLEREPAWLPPWRDLLRVYRRLEARGEIRGGRFIAGLSGEQFALPEAIGRCARCAAGRPTATLVCLAAADPANLPAA